MTFHFLHVTQYIYIYDMIFLNKYSHTHTHTLIKILMHRLFGEKKEVHEKFKDC